MATARFAIRTVRMAVLAGALSLSAACIAVDRNHGYMPPAEDLAEIVPGVDTRDSVAETLGPPTSAGLLNESGFYYVSSTVRKRGGLEPRVVSRELLAISFDAEGIVRNIERFGLERGQVISLERRVTDTTLANNGFLRQLLTNLGNFDAGSLIN